MACFNDLKSFLFPPFRAQAEFGKNKIAKFGLGGRFFRIFRPKFGFCPLGPRVYRLFVDRRNLGRFRAFSGSFSFVVFFVCVTHRRRIPALDAVEGFQTLVRVSFDNAGHSTNARCCDRCDRRSLSTSPVDVWQCFTDSGDYTRRFPSRSAGSFLPCLSECKHPAAFRALRALFGGL